MSEQTPHSELNPDENSLKREAKLAEGNASGEGTFKRFGVTQLTLVLLVVASVWLWIDERRIINEMQQQLAQKISEMGAGGKSGQANLAQTRELLNTMIARVADLEKQYTEIQDKRVVQESLYNDIAAGREETLLAEVEQLLLNAAQQLQLSANVRAALISMQSADTRLQRVNRPGLKELGKIIGQDMDKLRSLPKVDVVGMNRQLNQMISTVDELPLAYQQRVKDQPANREFVGESQPPKQSLTGEIWQEIKQLIRVENTGMQEIPLLLPEQQFMLRENLKLRLLSARIALLTRDEEVFRQELKTTQLWTARYFDASNPAGVEMQNGLKKLVESPISIDLPDLNRSLQAVRNYRLNGEKAMP